MSVVTAQPTPKAVHPAPPFAREGVVMSIAEYLKYSRAALQKYQYYEGKAWEMSGASYEHSAIATDTRRAFGNLSEHIGCEVLDSDMRVHIPASSVYYYPDACVVCASPQIDNDESLRNPIAIIEVLSPSTEAFDRNEKFADYRKIESLEHYLLIEQNRVRVTHHAKDATGAWGTAQYNALTDSLPLSLAGDTVSVPLASIYRRVFPAP